MNPLLKYSMLIFALAKYDKLETLVLGKRIMLDCALFDFIFQCSSSCFFILFDDTWAEDFDISFDQAKRCVAESPSDSLPVN